MPPGDAPPELRSSPISTPDRDARGRRRGRSRRAVAADGQRACCQPRCAQTAAIAGRCQQRLRAEAPLVSQSIVACAGGLHTAASPTPPRLCIARLSATPSPPHSRAAEATGGRARYGGMQRHARQGLEVRRFQAARAFFSADTLRSERRSRRCTLFRRPIRGFRLREAISGLPRCIRGVAAK